MLDIRPPNKEPAIRLGTAGWNVPKQCRTQFAETGSHLEKYAVVLNCTEINSSFHRPHRRSTYERWAGSVPANFRFAVKIPKAISHAGGLVFKSEDMDRFAGEVAGLGGKLGLLLLQLPPKRVFDSNSAGRLIAALKEKIPTPIVCEPRHASWFTDEANTWLAQKEIARSLSDQQLEKLAA